MRKGVFSYSGGVGEVNGGNFFLSGGDPFSGHFFFLDDDVRIDVHVARSSEVRGIVELVA
jgi:hypothetical protein